MEDTVRANTVDERDEKVKELSEQMSEWKPLVLGCSRLVLWEKPLEAAILFALPTIFFSILYFLDAGLLTILSFCGLAFVALDLGLPYLISYLKLDKNANESDDKVIFERFCYHLVTKKNDFCSFAATLKKFRTDKPPLFYVAISMLLISTAWIGVCINGICIAYYLSLGLIFYPGIRKHRLFEIGFAHVIDLGKNVYAKIKSKTAAAKKNK